MSQFNDIDRAIAAQNNQMIRPVRLDDIEPAYDFEYDELGFQVIPDIELQEIEKLEKLYCLLTHEAF